MKSLQLKDRKSNYDYKTIILNDLLQSNSQKIITNFRRQKAVEKALYMIQTRMQDPPTLNELASSSGLSRTYFSHVFKEVTGIKLQDYLTLMRLNKAKDLLNNIDLKIKQVAHEIGFRDPNYFCRSFKKRTGLNPTNWRMKNLVAQNLHLEDHNLS